MSLPRPILAALAALTLVPAVFPAAAPAPGAERFTFAVIGCVPYARYNDGGKALLAVRDTVSTCAVSRSNSSSRRFA